MNNKAIALTLYRRPAYTRQLFDALSQCYGIEDYEVFISCDTDDEKHEKDCAAVRDIAHEFASSCVAGKTTLTIQRPRLGIDRNKLFILKKAFEATGFVIFLEDDTPPACDTLRYFEAMNEMFRDDNTVMSISGYNRYLEEAEHNRVLQDEPYHIDHGTGFCPWGWAMWRDRYERIVGMEGEHYLEFCKTKDNDGNGLFDHYVTSWMDENQPAYTVYPVLPRSNHVGGHNAEHTVSAEWLLQHEYAPYTAANQLMPDPQRQSWTPKWSSDAC